MTTANPFSFCLGQFKLGLLSAGIERFPPNMLVILKKKTLHLVFVAFAMCSLLPCLALGCLEFVQHSTISKGFSQA